MQLFHFLFTVSFDFSHRDQNRHMTMKDLKYPIANMLEILTGRFQYMLQNVLVPQFITKHVIGKPLFDSYAFTAVFWLIISLIGAFVYNVVLYPQYFSRYRHLPTPKVSKLLPPLLNPQMHHTKKPIHRNVTGSGVIIRLISPSLWA